MTEAEQTKPQESQQQSPQPQTTLFEKEKLKLPKIKKFPINLKFRFPMLFIFALFITLCLGTTLLLANKYSQLRQQSTTTLTPSPPPANLADLSRDEVLRDWKTYKNTKYNYSLNYPNSFFTTNSQEDGVVIFYFSNAGEVSLFERPQITVQVHEKTTLMGIVNTLADGKRTAQEIIEESKITPARDGLLDLELQETIVNGQSAYYFEKIKEDYMGITTYLEKNSNTYAISLLSINEYHDYYKTVYYQILSTFQYIDPAENQDGEVDYGFECPDAKILDCSPCTSSPCPMFNPQYCSKGSPQYNWILKNCPDVTIIGLE